MTKATEQKNDKTTITNKNEILSLLRASQLKSEKVTIELEGNSIDIVVKEMTGETYIKVSEKAMIDNKKVNTSDFYTYAILYSCFTQDNELLFDSEDSIEILKSMRGDPFSKLVAVVGRLNNLLPN